MYAAARVIVVRVDGLEIPVEVTRKRVKNLNLRVRGDGSVALSIPMRTSPRAVEEFLERKADWIAARVRSARTREERKSHGDTGFPDRFPLWGELVPCGPDLVGQGGLVPCCPDLVSRGTIDEIYRAELRRALPAVADHVERRMGVHASRWSIRTMRTRWGSCTPASGAIRINARLAAYPPECLEFVVAHELVHLLEPSHNDRFHNLLDEFCPNNRLLARRLKQDPA